MTPSTDMTLNFEQGSNTDPMYSPPFPAQPDRTLNKINTLGAYLPDRVTGGYGKPSTPHLVIVEQPKPRGLRFRYECEGRSAGAIPGENSTTENRTYPTIRIENMDAASAVIVVSCVSKDDIARPHPHSLTGQNCKKGVCTVKLTNSNVISFKNLGIQCVKRKQVESSLAMRASVKVDRFHGGTATRTTTSPQCGFVFKASSRTKTASSPVHVRPAVSQCIYDKKAVSELVICRISKQAGSVNGGDQVFIFTEKIQKDNIQVRFFETTQDGMVWEAFADFGQGDVHRQFAIVIRTPAYRDTRIKQPVTISFQLRRPSDGEVSEPKPFQYIPEDPDPDGLNRKKRKLNFSEYFNDSVPPHSNTLPAEPAMACSSGDIKKRLKAKVSRKQPSTMTSDSVYPGNGPVTTLPQYPYTVSTSETLMATNQIAADPLQTAMDATINNTTVDVSQIDFNSFSNADYLSMDSNTACFINDSLQPGDAYSFGSLPSFSDMGSGLQGDMAQLLCDPNIGAHEIIPPK